MNCPECERKDEKIEMEKIGDDNITGGDVLKCPKCDYECIQRQ